MPWHPDDDYWSPQDLFSDALEVARLQGRITYIDESVRSLAPREYLSIIDVELPVPDDEEE